MLIFCLDCEQSLSFRNVFRHFRSRQRSEEKRPTARSLSFVVQNPLNRRNGGSRRGARRANLPFLWAKIFKFMARRAGKCFWPHLINRSGSATEKCNIFKKKPIMSFKIVLKTLVRRRRQNYFHARRKLPHEKTKPCQ